MLSACKFLLVHLLNYIHSFVYKGREVATVKGGWAEVSFSRLDLYRWCIQRRWGSWLLSLWGHCHLSDIQGNSPIICKKQRFSVLRERNSGCILGCTSKGKSSRKEIIHLSSGLLDYCVQIKAHSTREISTNEGQFNEGLLRGLKHLKGWGINVDFMELWNF